jgi:hypothetical protein
MLSPTAYSRVMKWSGIPLHIAKIPDLELCPLDQVFSVDSIFSELLKNASGHTQ